MNFVPTFLNVLLIVVLAIPGFFLRKVKLFSDYAANVLAVLLLYISQPFLMISSLLNKPFKSSFLINFAWIIGFAVFLQLLIYYIARFAFCKGENVATRRACIATSYLGNVGFMGIPVMQMLFPGKDELVLYTVIYNIAFNAMTWTLGVYAITGERKSINPLKIVLNPPTIAVILALPFYICNVKVSDTIMQPITYLGDMTLPLSMIILGVRLADIKPIQLINNWRVYLATFIKLVVSPLVSLGIMVAVQQFVYIDGYVLAALYVISAMPAASSALNFAEMYNGDRETAAASTLMSTILSVLTIPILMMLCPLLI